MSGSIIATPAYKAIDWQSFGTQVEKQRRGFSALRLTDFAGSSGYPQIAAGSVVELNGSLFQFPSNDSIGGSATASVLNYILLEVSGTGPDQIVTPSFTVTDPTWFDNKNGFYDAGGAKRYVAGGNVDSGPSNMYSRFVYRGDKRVYAGEWVKFIDTATRFKEFAYSWYSVPLVGVTTIGSITTQGAAVQFGANGTATLPVILPNYCYIAELKTYAMLSNGSITVYLRSADWDDVTPDTLASTSHSTTGSQSDTTISSSLVRNDLNKFWVDITRASHSTTAYVLSVLIRFYMNYLVHE